MLICDLIRHWCSIAVWCGSCLSSLSCLLIFFNLFVDVCVASGGVLIGRGFDFKLFFFFMVTMFTSRFSSTSSSVLLEALLHMMLLMLVTHCQTFWSEKNTPENNFYFSLPCFFIISLYIYVYLLHNNNDFISVSFFPFSSIRDTTLISKASFANCRVRQKQVDTWCFFPLAFCFLRRCCFGFSFLFHSPPSPSPSSYPSLPRRDEVSKWVQFLLLGGKRLLKNGRFSNVQISVSLLYPN